MKVLLDTCALIWLVNRHKGLSVAARDSIETAKIVYISSVTVWEIGIKIAKGKLILPAPLENWVSNAMVQHELEELALDHRSAALATSLPSVHSDPADRLLIALAMIHGLTLLTPDPLIRQYPSLKALW